jgi:hypothetical protein
MSYPQVQMGGDAQHVEQDFMLDMLNPFAPEILKAANIHPVTRLATDFLNHFNEVIMLLEICPTMPERVDDVLAWEHYSYQEHFIRSTFKDKDLAIAAYEAASEDLKKRLKVICYEMETVILNVRDSLAVAPCEGVRQTLVDDALESLKPMVAEAGAVINGNVKYHEEHPEENSQGAIDDLFNS